MNRAFFNAASTILQTVSKKIFQNMDRVDRLDLSINPNTQRKETSLELSIEKDIVQRLHELYPHHRILSEHAGSIAPLNEQNHENYTWVVDPLDGIDNFLSMIPIYAVSLSLFHEGSCVMSLVYQPISDELFSAIKGQGALVNGRKIRAYKVRPDKRPLVALAGDLVAETAVKDLSQRLDRQFSVEQLRVIGSTSLALAYHAMGGFDVFYAENIPLHSFSAGLLLAQESGCVIQHAQESDLMIKHAFSHLRKSK